MTEPFHDLSYVFDSIKYIHTSYTLWIGNGVTIHLASASDTSTQSLLFNNILDRIAKATAIPSSAEADAPQRLQVYRDKIGRPEFQKLLRNEIYAPVVNHIKVAMKNYPTHGNNVPQQFRSIASLGQLANPIVNFNIEQFSSYAIAGSGGPIALRCFRRHDESSLPPEQITYFSEGGDTGGAVPSRYSRIIYHPHGALDLSGLCVMCADEYDAMHGTPALRLAVHLAIDSYLVIAGMSLNDAYLREQLLEWPEHYAKVIWFLQRPDKCSTDIKKWINAMHHRKKIEIGIVEADDWSDFWQAVDRFLPSPTEENLINAWSVMVQRATNPGSRTAQIARRHPLLAKKFQGMLLATGERD